MVGTDVREQSSKHRGRQVLPNKFEKNVKPKFLSTSRSQEPVFCHSKARKFVRTRI